MAAGLSLPMIWIGGAQGAGKTTLAWSLARDEDLPLHPVDLWTYDHVARMPGVAAPHDRLGPEAAADAFETYSHLRLDLVLADVAARGLGNVPALVEGPQLSPGLAAEVSLPRGRGVWLVPDPVRTRLALEERLARQERHTRDDVPAEQAAAQRARLENRLLRDAVLAARFQRAAAQAGLPVIEIPADPDWAAIAAEVRAAVEPALLGSPRLEPGAALSRQRRLENAAAVRQGRLWAADAGLTTVPSYPFGCECGTSGCHAVWRATPDEYEARAAEGRVFHHRGSLRPVFGRKIPMIMEEGWG